jgi:mono/diheme cytochrome c family protein
MRLSSRFSVAQLAVALSVAAAVSLFLDRGAVAQTPPATDAIAHGAYLVGDAGQCSDCHGVNLGGAPLHIPGPPGVPWATSVPSLRGLPMFASDADALVFLRTAKLPNGNYALGPMPHFK